jgi:hypothetical protein
MAENEMVRKSQLLEWQQKRLSRLPHLYTAGSVPNWEKIDENGHPSRMLRKAIVASSEVVQTSVQADVYNVSRLKLVPFIERTGAENTSTRIHFGVADLSTETSGESNRC